MPWQTAIPGIAFTLIAAAFYLVVRHQNLQRYRIRLEMIQKERLVAMEKGIPFPELPDYDEQKQRTADSLFALMRVNPRWPLGVGALLVVLGAGITIALYLSEESYHNRVWSMGLIPISGGIGLFLQYWLMRVHDR